MANVKNSEDLQPLDNDSGAKSGSAGRGEAVLRKMVEENLKLAQENHKMIKKIKHYIFMQQLMGVVKIIFFLAVVSAGFIFLPPLLSNLLGYYKELLGNLGGFEDVKSQLDAIDLQNIPGLIKQK